MGDVQWHDVDMHSSRLFGALGSSTIGPDLFANFVIPMIRPQI